MKNLIIAIVAVMTLATGVMAADENDAALFQTLYNKALIYLDKTPNAVHSTHAYTLWRRGTVTISPPEVLAWFEEAKTRPMEHDLMTELWFNLLTENLKIIILELKPTIEKKVGWGLNNDAFMSQIIEETKKQNPRCGSDDECLGFFVVEGLLGDDKSKNPVHVLSTTEVTAKIIPACKADPACFQLAKDGSYLLNPVLPDLPKEIKKVPRKISNKKI